MQPKYIFIKGGPASALNNQIFMKKKYISKTVIIFILTIFTILAPSTFIVLAQDMHGADISAKKAGVLTDVSFAEFLGRIAGAALAIAGSLFLFLIVYGGILMLTSAGKDAQVKKGKDVITWAIIGAIVLGAAYAITNLVFQAISGGQ